MGPQPDRGICFAGRRDDVGNAANVELTGNLARVVPAGEAARADLRGPMNIRVAIKRWLGIALIAAILSGAPFATAALELKLVRGSPYDLEI